MQSVSDEEIYGFVRNNIIQSFYQSRLEILKEVSLYDVLKQKNPYLFKAKNIITTAQDFVTELLQAYLSSQEETLFGSYLEGLAIFICSKMYGGFKSASEGIDLEFERDGTRYIVSIKSGPYWGNSSQISRMRSNFIKAKRILSTNTSRKNVVAVNGCCYGKDNQPDKGEYLKLCGQQFWSFISGDDELYVKIIESIDQGANEQEAKLKYKEFKKLYDKKINFLTGEFLNEFCDTGETDWEKLLKFASSKADNGI